MNCPWYWYVDDDYQGNHVRIHAEKPGSVVGRWWVIPVKDCDYQRWNVYLQPWWIAYKEIGSQALMDPPTLDCEWVFVKRVKWDPKPQEAYVADLCECCGQEIY